MKHLVIFASGRGSNAQKIITYFKDNQFVKVEAVFSNNSKAPALEIAKNEGVKTYSFTRNDIYKSEKLLQILKQLNPDLIILAGFMWIIPENLIDAFPDKITNIHPSLLPKYGGKGMYGDRVHKAVMANHESETGISIHYVNKYYDEGQLIAQFKTSLSPNDNLEQVIKKVRQLEHQYYPQVIEQLLFS